MPNESSPAWVKVSAVLFAAVLAPAIVRGELPSIRLDRMTPLGCSAGSGVEVQTTGRDTDDANRLIFDHPGITAEPTEAGKFRVAVAADVPEGTYDARLVGRYGVSNPRLFAVSHGLTDVAEQDLNNVPNEAQPVTINSAVYGTSDGNNQDVFRIEATAGQRIAILCEAQKLDSEMDASLIVSDSGGGIVASVGDYFGRDPLIDFVAPSAGAFDVTVHDLSYRGGYPYRLVVTTRACIENVFPRAVEPGQSIELTAYGRNLGPAAAPSTWLVDRQPLEELRFTFAAPATTSGQFTFIDHPTDHSVLPTAATCTLNGLHVLPPTMAGALRPAPVVLAEGPVTVEAEPNDTQQSPQPIMLPATLSGRFDQPRDADWYSFEIAEGGPYSIEVFCERIAGRADPYVVVIDEQDNRVVEFDDYGQRTNAFDGHLRDPVGQVALAAGKKYRLLVQDRYGRGGARYQYVLTVRRPQPDFHVAAIHSENPGPSGTTVWRGGTAWLDLVIHRRDGFNGPITVTAEGLPPGMHATPAVIDAESRGVLVLSADADAAEWTGTIDLVARGRRDGPDGPADLVRVVRPYTRVWAQANIGSSRPMRGQAAAIRELAPYGLRIEPDQVRVTAGKPVDLKLVVKRHWPDFTDKVRAIPLGFPSNFQMAEFDAPSGQAETPFTINVQAGTRPGVYTLSVLGQAQAPFNKDPQATDRPNTLVSMPSVPVTIEVTAP